ncbi:hypothetical protein BEL04_17695 [Mucilaginibacter sp. PPCGB 2223]|uniref:hypothetical protein n=1 Tax=Mucilaginibacter sp. PPCGB 2223 TaxID=1886027 RepID=UPI000824C33E|nr:hypothetical protein [Mucilaginibacter sp. PPCGB 2223]OCX51844.1 hypothetical protein BEL04_17695 [Mucilaginibacter sp. PPCGB 2223]
MGFWPFSKSKKTTEKKFKEPLSTSVLTTKFVTDDNKDITYVTHNEDDGSWEFLSDDVFDDQKVIVRVIDLGQMLERDATLLDLADMPVGHYAVRDSRDDAWVISKNEEM